MALLTKKKKYIEINVAPLIDIVFLLLIFFMLTSEFTDFKTIDMISPNQSSTSIQKNDLPIIINLSENGLVEIDKIEIKLEDLSETIQMKLMNSKNKKIIISTLNETKINNLIIVVDTIRSLGIENIALITKEKMNILEKKIKKKRLPNLVPLINIVFLLLIFFMLSGTLSKKDLFEVEPPSSYTASNAEAPEIIILISSDNKISLDDKIISSNELETYLTSLLKKQNIEEVLIKADGNASSGTLSKVIRMIRNTGIKRAAIVTKSVL